MRRLLMSLTALALLAALGSAQAVEVRFYPTKLRPYELDPTHGLRSIVLQNIAIINDGKTDATMSQVEIEVIERGVPYEVKTLRAAELDRVAATGAKLQSSGMLAMLGFQFGGKALLPGKTTLSPTRVLKPGQALLVTQVVIAIGGTRDAVRVNASTQNGMGEATAFISTESWTEFSLPLEGRWYDGSGPSLHTHHRWAVPEEFAHDFMRIGADSLPYSGDGTQFTDYYAYGQPVLAAADGQVVVVLADESEDATLMQRAGESLDLYLTRIVGRQNEQLQRGARGIVGNHVIIKHTTEHGPEFSLYAHLKPGSVLVKPDDLVKRGQQIAAVGSSGSSTEPHLHFQVCDAPDPLMCAGIPAKFVNIEIYGALQPRQLQSGDIVRNMKVDTPPQVDTPPK
jgi:murein DD-endopeptidase MepM/ murein hydrolase activator NlpD